jgi:hypothetical protein
VDRPPAGWRGWVLTSCPREYTFTRWESARTLTRCPISSPGIEYNALATSMCRSRATFGEAKIGWSYGIPGRGSSSGASTWANTSAGRAAVVPWMRSPAVTEHQCSTRDWPWPRSVNASPRKKLSRTYCTLRSTRGLDHAVDCT